MRRFGAGRRLAVVLAALCALGSSPGGAIVGGTADEGALARGTVMVLSSRGGVCSGIVLARDAVLTAAHCVARGAEHRIHFRGAGGAPVLVGVAAKAVHPGFDAGAIKARRRSIDLALIRSAEPLPERFAPARLSPAAPASGSRLTLGGYGAAREGDPRSTGTFRVAAVTAVAPHGPSRILVWAKGEGAGACQGDSGGPIASEEAGVMALATWAAGPDGAGCGDLTQGVLLGPQRDWIDGTLARWGAAARWM